MKTRELSLGQEDALEEEMATHSNILAWEILWTEEPGRLQSMGSQKSLIQLCEAIYIFIYIGFLGGASGRETPDNGEEVRNMGRRAWWAMVHRVAKSRT